MRACVITLALPLSLSLPQPARAVAAAAATTAAADDDAATIAKQTMAHHSVLRGNQHEDVLRTFLDGLLSSYKVECRLRCTFGFP